MARPNTPPFPPLTERVAAALIAARWWLLAIAAAALAAAWGPASRLDFDRRVEQMFPAKDPSVDAYQLLQHRLGGSAVAMLVYRDGNLFTPEGLARVSRTASLAADLPGVSGVLSLAQVDDALSSIKPSRMLGVGQVLGIGGAQGREEGAAILDDGPLAEGFRELFADYTHNRDGTHAAVVVLLDSTQVDRRAEVVAQLRRIADQLPEANQPVALVGEPVLVAEGFELVEADGERLSTTTIILLGLTTVLMFRSPRWVIAELVVILWAVFLTRGAATVLGLRLTLVSSMLTAVVTVIAVASVIHVAVRFRTRRRRGDSPREATQVALAKVLAPIFWACLTDAAGFAALAVSRVGPVRDFGLMMTLGAVMVLVGLVLILPALMLVPPHWHAARPIRWDRHVRRLLVRWVLRLRRYRWAVGALTLIVAGGTVVGLLRLETETNFIRNFRSSSELAQGYAMVETEFGGAGVWDVLLPAPRQLTSEYLESVRQLEDQLREMRIGGSPAGEPPQNNAVPEARLSKVLSMADADATAATAPLLRFAPPPVRIAGMRAAMPAFVDMLLTPAEGEDPRYLRIMLRSPERLPAAEKLALISAVTDAVTAHTSTDRWRQLLGDTSADPAGLVTGYYVLLARLIESLLSDQWLCLIVAATAVFVMMAVAFRSLRLAAVCMIPNALPVLAVLGWLGLFDIRVNMGAAMIAAVSIGLTIDGSIHFLFSCRTAYRRGASALRAVLYAQSRIGMPVLLATVALALGFSVLSTSAFIPTVTFGVLVTAALVAGTAANLTLLPLLLISTMRR